MNCATEIPLMRRAQTLMLLAARECFTLWSNELFGTAAEATAYGHWLELRRCAEVIEKKGELPLQDVQSVACAARWLYDRGYDRDLLGRLAHLLEFDGWRAA